MGVSLDKFLNTSESILSLTDQESIFTKYLYSPDLRKKYFNPFRNDEDPGCTFYYGSTGTLYFVDWAWGKKHYNCFNIVQEYYKCNYYEALQHIRQDVKKGELKKVERRIEHKPKAPLRVLKKNYTNDELTFWNVGGMNFTQSYLESKGIYSIETIWESDWVIDNLKMTFAYIEEGEVKQVYFPNNKNTLKRRFINSPGYIIGGYNELPFVEDYVVISKSKKCSFYMKELGINNFYIVNESVVIDEDIYNTLKLQYKNVFILGDNDIPGKKLLIKYKHKYPDINILVFPRNEPKDFTENLIKYGKQYLLNLIQEMRQKFNINESTF